MEAHDGTVVAREMPLVLVVEDEPEIRRFYARLLAADGCRTDESHNGFQALERATAILPDLIVSDIALPGMDGMELCRCLRADPRTARIPVLAVTGYGDRNYPDRALAAGANHVLIKPFTAERLLAEVHRLLNASRAIGHQSLA